MHEVFIKHKITIKKLEKDEKWRTIRQYFSIPVFFNTDYNFSTLLMLTCYHVRN